jgi:hypothetical protein
MVEFLFTSCSITKTFSFRILSLTAVLRFNPGDKEFFSICWWQVLVFLDITVDSSAEGMNQAMSHRLLGSFPDFRERYESCSSKVDANVKAQRISPNDPPIDIRGIRQPCSH